MYRLTFVLLIISSFAIYAESAYEIEDMPIFDEDFDLIVGLDGQDIAQIDAMLESYEDDVFEQRSYVCLGSFRSQEKAVAMSTGLSVAGYEVIVRPAFVNGSEFHRVLLGPVVGDRAFQREFMQWLSDMGYEGAWLVEGVKSYSSGNKPDFNNNNELTVLQEPEESPSQKQLNSKEPLTYPGQDSTYNLARLRVIAE